MTTLRRRTSSNYCQHHTEIAEKRRVFAWRIPCVFQREMHGLEKRFVYIIRSDTDATRQYVGVTNDVWGRLEWHNHGPSGHTLTGRPWSLVVSMEFSRERDAVAFEKYLKSGSGRAFAKRHFSQLDVFRTHGWQFIPST